MHQVLNQMGHRFAANMLRELGPHPATGGRERHAPEPAPRRVLVLGATGYVGSRLGAGPAPRAGHHVIAVVLAACPTRGVRRGGTRSSGAAATPPTPARSPGRSRASTPSATSSIPSTGPIRPPRPGRGPDVAEAVAASEVRRLVYLSGPVPAPAAAALATTRPRGTEVEGLLATSAADPRPARPGWSSGPAPPPSRSSASWRRCSWCSRCRSGCAAGSSRPPAATWSGPGGGARRRRADRQPRRRRARRPELSRSARDRSAASPACCGCASPCPRPQHRRAAWAWPRSGSPAPHRARRWPRACATTWSAARTGPGCPPTASRFSTPRRPSGVRWRGTRPPRVARPGDAGWTRRLPLVELVPSPASVRAAGVLAVRRVRAAAGRARRTLGETDQSRPGS